jgi:hypothetical protein
MRIKAFGSRRRLVSAAVALAGVTALSLAPIPAQASSPTQVFNFGNHLCLDDYGYSTAAGARVVIWGCNGGGNQKWTEMVFTSPLSNFQYPDTIALIRNQYSNMCLDVQGFVLSNGTGAIQWPCDTNDQAQWFKVRSSGQGPSTWFLSVSGMYLDDPYQTSNWGTQVWFWQYNGSVAQIWNGSTFTPTTTMGVSG